MMKNSFSGRPYVHWRTSHNAALFTEYVLYNGLQYSQAFSITAGQHDHFLSETTLVFTKLELNTRLDAVDDGSADDLAWDLSSEMPW